MDGQTELTDFALWRIFELFAIDLSVFGNEEVPKTLNEYIWGIKMDQYKMYDNVQKTGPFRWDIGKAYFALDRAPEARRMVNKQEDLVKISASMLNHNLWVQLMAALERSYESWAELIRCVLGNGIVDRGSMNNQLLLKLLHSILERLSTTLSTTYNGTMWSRVANILSQVALNIMYYFRQSLTEQSSVKIAVAGCRAILEGMVGSIRGQKAARNPRANLYSCLSNYLHYCKFKAPNVLSDEDESRAINLYVNFFKVFLFRTYWISYILYVIRGEKVVTEKNKLDENNMRTLLQHKDELLEVYTVLLILHILWNNLYETLFSLNYQQTDCIWRLRVEGCVLVVCGIAGAP